MKENFCKECGQNINDKWPKISHLLEVCPQCSSERANKTTYTGAPKKVGIGKKNDDA